MAVSEDLRQSRSLSYTISAEAIEDRPALLRRSITSPTVLARRVRVRYERRQQEYFAFADRHIDGASVLHRLRTMSPSI